MGLNEGINTFVDDAGKLVNPVYVPAYIRRYPFLLAKLQPNSEELSLCFDPTSGALGKFDERSEEHTSELQSLMRISYAVFCLKKKQTKLTTQKKTHHLHNNTIKTNKKQHYTN